MAACAAIGIALLVAVLLTAGGAPQPVPPPLPDPGPLTGWALPVIRLLAGAASTLTVGLLLTAVVLLPVGSGGRLTAAGRAAARSARWPAIAATVLLLIQTAFTLSDLLAMPVGQTLDVTLWWALVFQTELGGPLVLRILLIGAVAVLIGSFPTATRVIVALLAALCAVALQSLGSHSAAADNHTLAIVSLAGHLLAVTLWVGGLAGLGLLALRGSPWLRESVTRLSFLALCCVVAVASSGVINAATRLPGMGALLGSAYGLVLVVKMVAFGALAGIGWLHRRRTVPRFAAGQPVRRAFVRLAAVELLVMAGTYGVAVGLGRTPPPPEEPPLLAGRTPTEALLGYPLPEPPTLGTLFGGLYLDPFGLTVALIAIPLYLAGVRVLRRRGDAWPVRRTVAWLAGVAAILLVTCTGVGRYAAAMFSVHMVQHITLNMVAPLLLVLGAPITLALRTLPLRDRRTLMKALRSRFARVVGSAPVVTGIFIASLFVLYFTPLFEAAMHNHWGHLLMQAHFLLSGFLFFWLILGTDPDPGRPSGPFRIVLLLAVVVSHTIFAMVLVFGLTVSANGYYTQLAHPWLGSLVEDQALGGAITWVLGEMIIVGVLAAVILRWFAAAERADRAAARARAHRAAVRVD